MDIKKLLLEDISYLPNEITKILPTLEKEFYENLNDLLNSHKTNLPTIKNDINILIEDLAYKYSQDVEIYKLEDYIFLSNLGIESLKAKGVLSYISHIDNSEDLAREGIEYIYKTNLDILKNKVVLEITTDITRKIRETNQIITLLRKNPHYDKSYDKDIVNTLNDTNLVNYLLKNKDYKIDASNQDVYHKIIEDNLNLDDDLEKYHKRIILKKAQEKYMENKTKELSLKR